MKSIVSTMKDLPVSLDPQMILRPGFMSTAPLVCCRGSLSIDLQRGVGHGPTSTPMALTTRSPIADASSVSEASPKFSTVHVARARGS